MGYFHVDYSSLKTRAQRISEARNNGTLLNVSVIILVCGLWNIPLCRGKMCHCDWYNRKLTGQ